MSVITVLLIILAIGVLVWAVNEFGSGFVAPSFMRLFNVMALVITVLWLVFTVFGLTVPDLHIGKV